MLKKVKICLAVLAISTLASIAVNAATVKNPDPKKVTKITTTTTEETTETTTEETTEEVTDEETETTTKEKSEGTTSSNIEGSGQLTTIALDEFSENPTDAQGQPLTGKDLAAYKVVAKTYKDKWTAKTSPLISETTLHSDADYTEKAKTFTFDNGGQIYNKEI